MHLKRSGSSHSLGSRLVLVTLGFCFVFTVFTVAVRTYSAWNEAWSAMNADLKLLEQVYRPTLSKAIWEMDRDSLRASIESTKPLAVVGHIALTIRSGDLASEVIERSADGWQTSTLAPTRHSDLTYAPFPGGSENVGSLTLAGDERVLWARLRGEVTDIVVTQLLQSLLLAGLIMLMFNRSVTVHVQHIARHLGQLAPDKMGQALRLARNPKHSDELTLLETGVNQLQSKLTDHLAQLHHYEEELGAHRDHLADLVQERTAELESLTEAQQLVLSLSNRLIHASHESFDASQRECLLEVAQRLGANRALWLVPTAASPAFRVFTEWRSDGRTESQASEPLLRGLIQVPQRLAREEVLFFGNQAEMLLCLNPLEAAIFTLQPVGASALALLHSDGENYGMLFIGKPLGQCEWLAQDRALVTMTAQLLLHSVRHQAQLLNILSTQKALRAANAQLEVLSRHDALTGLFNRRHFDEMKEAEFQRALRTGQPLSLLICDIDHFKAFNDHYGHARGDQCLRDVAQVFRNVISRSGDVLARIGGEEFAVMLPNTSEPDAWQVAERLRVAVSDLRLAHAASETGSHVTISIGLAQLLPRYGTDFEALFEAADQALYRAKSKGRDRIESSLPPIPQGVV
ncbi:GGDEF domain-containing protein [Rhodoferax sp.]|uniref:GGDEF domain-containing protein n=1 Tax=Rhodoferax sp. TaxID=50421 RepID=UPI002851004B|nr:GGDEF domain-containing protein [Rhodoferax sp.]MDR3369878.1 GGDEF domain-containing protein [Rhodoferax sp.]